MTRPGHAEKHPMQRFHFHLRTDGPMYRDGDGCELPGLAAARAHAAAVAHELIRHSGAATRHWSLFVEDERAERRFDLFFSDLDPLPRPRGSARIYHLPAVRGADGPVRRPERDADDERHPARPRAAQALSGVDRQLTDGLRSGHFKALRFAIADIRATIAVSRRVIAEGFQMLALARAMGSPLIDTEPLVRRRRGQHGVG